MRRGICSRSAGMNAFDFLPPRKTLPALLRAAERCQGCELYRRATQTVFGAGPARARLLLVGEQPGDQEDIQGEPFVGPAGRMLRETLARLHVDPADVYLTNAVKHFKWTPRGSRRLHAKPSAREMAACRPWLEAEIAAVEPEVIVCLGATAAQSLLGRDFRLTASHGKFVPSDFARRVMATYHPSALLRAGDRESRRRLRREFRADLKRAVQAVLASHG